ncbi:hypothetical protein CROQUDRAFT_158651 [Cronartium quercuum f. sp. fusiforme G11]|uniref:Uncharacterized protein n=1 Tax=Cronartium quercuum f. sp. fusiforme G11 TaxID=708437 RepID=A0A9P6TFN0_9BASI|nr:hypothetical protein CROQUDRAFT_158651 [Cronartium quercuum f. sp. fusiforme G11]
MMRSLSDRLHEWYTYTVFYLATLAVVRLHTGIYLSTYVLSQKVSLACQKLVIWRDRDDFTLKFFADCVRNLIALG